MNSPRITYSPHPNTTPGMELHALAAIYSLCLQKHREKQKTDEPAPEPAGLDGTKVQEDSANVILPD
jgi:hypothetical protein